jgi:TIR domain
MFGWDEFTNLPMENGALYFALMQVLFSVHVPTRHYELTGCIYDFHGDKRGVDAGMRAAFLCANCDKAVRIIAGESDRALLNDIITLLDVLSRASRAHESIFRTSDALLSGDSFDVFLCHNSKDKPIVHDLAREIRGRQLAPWLDDEQIPPGRPWQPILSEAIPRIRAAAVVVGASGIGPWQDQEVQAVLNEFVRRASPVIPVLLSMDDIPRPELPLFLRNFMWLERGHTEFLDRLVWGITGRRPN